jgi:hypothetical protein
VPSITAPPATGKSFESPWQPSTKTTHLHSSPDLEGARRLASLPQIGPCQAEGGSHCGSHCRMRPSDGPAIDKPSHKLWLHEAEVEDIARDPGPGGGDPLLITCGCSCSLPFLYCLGQLLDSPLFLKSVCLAPLSSSSNLVLNHFPPSVGQPDPRAARFLGLQEKDWTRILSQDRTVRPRHCTESLWAISHRTPIIPLNTVATALLRHATAKILYARRDSEER